MKGFYSYGCADMQFTPGNFFIYHITHYRYNLCNTYNLYKPRPWKRKAKHQDTVQLIHVSFIYIPKGKHRAIYA